MHQSLIGRHILDLQGRAEQREDKQKWTRAGEAPSGLIYIYSCSFSFLREISIELGCCCWPSLECLKETAFVMQIGEMAETPNLPCFLATSRTVARVLFKGAAELHQQFLSANLRSVHSDQNCSRSLLNKRHRDDIYLRRRRRCWLLEAWRLRGQQTTTSMSSGSHQDWPVNSNLTFVFTFFFSQSSADSRILLAKLNEAKTLRPTSLNSGFWHSS